MARDITKTAAFAFRMCIEELQRTEQENPFQVCTPSGAYVEHFALSLVFECYVLNSCCG